MPGPAVVTISLKGNEEMAARINAAPAALRVKVIRPGIRAGTKLVLERALSSTPWARVRGGDWKVRAAKRKKFVGSVVPSPTRASLSIPQEARYYFLAALELGWQPTGRTATRLATARAAYSRVSARRALHAGARIPGRHILKTALLGAPQLIFDAAAAKMRQYMGPFGLIPTYGLSDGED